MIRALLLLLFALPAGAATWYVRPIAGEYGTETGTSYDNAFDGFLDAWTNGADIDDGDTLCIDGEFVGLADAQVGGGSPWMIRVLDGGVAGARITLDGDCAGSGVRAVLDGNSEAAVGIKFDTTAAMPTYVTIKNLEIKNFLGKGISTYRTSGTDDVIDAHNTFDNVWIHHIGNGDAGDQGFDFRGRYVTLKNSVIEDVSDDAINGRGKFFTLDNVRVARFSLGTATGDGFQLSGGEMEGLRVSNYQCADTQDDKQCLIIDSPTDSATNIVIEDFDFSGLSGGGSSNGLYLTGNGTVARRGFIRGFGRGVNIDSTASATNIQVESVISTGATIAAFNVGFNAGAGNVFEHTIAHGSAVGYNLQPNATLQTVRNSIAVGNSACGIDRPSGSATELYNDSHGNGIDFCLSGANTAAGTGSISVDPLFIGGPNPTTAEGFRPNCLTSPLKDAGANVGAIQDFTGRYFTGTPEIGAYACQGGTARAASDDRSAATARAASTARSTADARP